MKYEIETKIKWKYNSKKNKEQVQQQVFDEMAKIFSDLNYNNFDLVVSIKEKSTSSELVKIKEFTWNQIKHEIYKSKNNFSFSHKGKKLYVKMNNQRFFLFRENNKCVCCGLEGNTIVCEKNLNDVTPHLNLYAVKNDKYILLTKDHINPKCVGGKDKHSNYQTMCSLCNNLKGHSYLSIKNLKKIRNIYDRHKNGNKKKLHDLIDKAKAKLSHKPNITEYQSAEYIKSLSGDAVKTRCDLSIYFDGNRYFGLSIYDTPSRRNKYIGNIRRNIYLEPLFTYKNFVECQICKSLVVNINKSLLKNT